MLYSNVQAGVARLADKMEGRKFKKEEPGKDRHSLAPNSDIDKPRKEKKTKSTTNNKPLHYMRRIVQVVIYILRYLPDEVCRGKALRFPPRYQGFIMADLDPTPADNLVDMRISSAWAMT